MNSELFWTLLKPVHPMAAGFCRKLTGDRDEGDDLYQDGLLAALRNFDTLRDEATFRPWLFRILINRYKNRQRSGWWRRRITLNTEVVEHDRKVNPQDEYNSRRWLQRALSALSPEDRALIVLYEIEGWPVAELAATFGRPAGTIKTRLRRARRKMRETLERFMPRPGTEIIIDEVPYALQRSKAADK